MQFAGVIDPFDWARAQCTAVRARHVRGRRFVRAVAVLIASYTLSCALARAQEAEPIAPVTENGVTYVTGGVGEDESSAIRAMSSKFNLRMLFAGKDGIYLSDVDVVVTGSSGAHVLTVRTSGPMLYARLAPGRYHISATGEQGKLERWATVPQHGGTNVNFYWR
ncbi:carboxypeptidase regulatory-like domain-containing protein [Trinickia dinghuensis]|uniref:carboxypeptidase regulatory-like domain-containing protein n=1 Tax=Trinickia dinghuensis TaxID=2291023 RepID=UPI0011C06948|nr:carboxypeptidase regulatory-like domain-containing protein [Trinickia dinghuensis]